MNTRRRQREGEQQREQTSPAASQKQSEPSSPVTSSGEIRRLLKKGVAVALHFYDESDQDRGDSFRVPDGLVKRILESGKFGAVRHCAINDSNSDEFDFYIRFGIPVLILCRGWDEAAKGPKKLARRLAWPGGENDKFESVMDWVNEF